MVIGTRSKSFLTGAGMEKRSVTLRDWRWKEDVDGGLCVLTLSEVLGDIAVWE